MSVRVRYADDEFFRLNFGPFMAEMKPLAPRAPEWNQPPAKASTVFSSLR
jgi:hypothetical protein